LVTNAKPGIIKFMDDDADPKNHVALIVRQKGSVRHGQFAKPKTVCNAPKVTAVAVAEPTMSILDWIVF
jgi:hypothetical protein